jgi:hypothetical protein
MKVFGNIQHFMNHGSDITVKGSIGGVEHINAYDPHRGTRGGTMTGWLLSLQLLKEGSFRIKVLGAFGSLEWEAHWQAIDRACHTMVWCKCKTLWRRDEVIPHVFLILFKAWI